MTKEDIIKFIDGIPFYRYEYTYFLYQKLEEKDKEIERLKAREQECIDKYLNMSKYASKMEDKYIIAKSIIDELEKSFVNDDKKIKEYNIEHPESPLNNYSRYYLDRLKELKEGK